MDQSADQNACYASLNYQTGCLIVVDTFRYVWTDVQAADVIDFLTSYKTHPEAHKVNSLLLSRFIQSLVSEGELTTWTIALIGGGDGGQLELSDAVSVKMLQRTAHGAHPDRYSIGRLMSPRDEAIDLDEDSWNAALAITKAAFHADGGRKATSKEPTVPNGPAIRRVRGFGAAGVPGHPERGVLFIYALDPEKAGAESGLPKDSPPVIVFAISFPASKSGAKVEYRVNNVAWELEYGGTD